MSYHAISAFFSENISFDNVKVLCIGDVLLDKFIDCYTNRISSESPLPVMVMKSDANFLGGSGNVSCNVAALGARATCIGAVGDDVNADTVIDLFDKNNITFENLHQEGTIVKQRYVSGKHNMFRVDSEFFYKNNNKEAVDKIIERYVSESDVVIISNYNYNLIDYNISRSVIDAVLKHNKAVFVDPNKAKSINFYDGAFLLKPNRKEFEEITQKKYNTPDEMVCEAQKLIAKHNIKYCLITLSENGQMLIDKNGYKIFDNMLSSNIRDVSGAGDTVIATLAVAFARTANIELSVMLGNLAANIVVRNFGTSQTSVSEMKHIFYKEKGELICYDRDSLKDVVLYLQSQGRVVGLANGCFDIVHDGHVKLLNNAKKLCDYLIVAINSDSSVKGLKGPSRPFNNEFSRTLVISNIVAVDAVIIFEESSPIELIKYLKPNIVFKGKDYNPETLPEYSDIVSFGGKVEFLDLVEGFSTTGILNKINKENK